MAHGTPHRPDDPATAELAGRFERLFSRPPSSTELARFRRSEAGLHLRLPMRTKRSIAALLVSL
jgi:hypothetical protein